MLAGVRSRFLLSFVVALSVAAFFPAQAQVNGVPPSVTSMGFGGRPINGVPPSVTSIGFGGNFINGVRPSVTSLGSNGYGNNWSVFGECCANLFQPMNPHPHGISGRRHRRRDHDPVAVGVLEPAYIPYAVPYAPENDADASDDDSADDDSADDDSAVASGPRHSDPSGKRAGNRDSGPVADAEMEEPVAVQPSTVLVFKDGHQSDVLNYAIVGDTLFDFEAGRTMKILLADLDLKATRKANDDRGVDFQLPANATGQ